MALIETQALLARLFTDSKLRRDFFQDPEAVAKSFGLDGREARTLSRLERQEVEAFAQSLLGKRALDARKALPLTARALGENFERLLFMAIDGPPSPGCHRADAAALTALLPSTAEPPWIADLARYEMAFVTAGRPGCVFLLHRFDYPVDEIARQLLAGQPPDVFPRRRFGLWARGPWGRLIQWLL